MERDVAKRQSLVGKVAKDAQFGQARQNATRQSHVEKELRGDTKHDVLRGVLCRWMCLGLRALNGRASSCASDEAPYSKRTLVRN